MTYIESDESSLNIIFHSLWAHFSSSLLLCFIWYCWHTLNMFINLVARMERCEKKTEHKLCGVYSCGVCGAMITKILPHGGAMAIIYYYCKGQIPCMPVGHAIDWSYNFFIAELELDRHKLFLRIPWILEAVTPWQYLPNAMAAELYS